MANRFDKAYVSAYNPLSMEELAMVPMMKRKQHDETLAKQELIRSGLAKTDPLDVHLEEATRLKQDLEGQMDTTAQELATQGVNNDMIGKTIALNRQYQDLTSPTGRIGQINAAKGAYYAAKKEFFDSPELKEVPLEVKNKRWEEHSKKYTGYEGDESNPALKVTNISTLGAPKYQDLEKDLSWGKSLLGSETTTMLNNIGAHFEQGRFGGLIMKSADGKTINTDNIKNLKALTDNLNAKWLQATGEGAQYADFAYMDKQNIIDRLNSGILMMKEDKELKDLNYNYNFVDAPKAEELPSNGTIISNDSTIKSDAVNREGYTDALTRIKALQGQGSRSKAEQAELADLKELREAADAKLNKNKDYVSLNTAVNANLKKWERLASKMDLSPDDKQMIKDNPNSLPQILFSLGFGRFKGNKNDPDLKLISEDSSLRTFNDLVTKRQGIKDNAWQESSSLRHNYSYMPDTPKAEGEWNLHNENVYNVLKGIPNLSSVLDLTGIETTGGLRKDLEDEDVANIQELIKNSDGKSFKISNIKTFGDNKAPEITATFNTNANASQYDAQGMSWDDEYGGSEKPVTVTFKLKRFTNSPDTGSAPGFKNLTGAISQFYKNKGGVNGITGNFQGHEVYNSLITNAYADLTNEQLAYRYQKDSDAQEVLNDRAMKRGVQPSQLLAKYGKYKN